jgi:hypothetical protein
MISARERDLTEQARSAFGSRSRNRRVTPLFDYTLAAKVKTRDKRRHTRLFYRMCRSALRFRANSWTSEPGW